jgi:SAM-dependent methyltransferase
MAQAFPSSCFYGFDTHAGSIEEARRNAAALGLAERASFARARAVEIPGERYALICFFDTLHDLGDPVAAARRAADVLAPGGTVLLVEPFAHDRIEDNLSAVGQMYYAGSTLICCAHAISEGVKLVLGRGEARGGVPQSRAHTLSACCADSIQPELRSAALSARRCLSAAG